MLLILTEYIYQTEGGKLIENVENSSLILKSGLIFYWFFAVMVQYTIVEHYSFCFKENSMFTQTLAAITYQLLLSEFF